MAKELHYKIVENELLNKNSKKRYYLTKRLKESTIDTVRNK